MDRKKAIRIALVAPIFGEEYVQDLVRGVYDAMEREREINNQEFSLCLFDGNPLQPEAGLEDLANRIYNKVGPEEFAGVLVSGGLLGHYVEEWELNQFYRRFSPLPLVLIGAGAKGFLQVTLDNYSGIYNLTEHMITVHKAKRFFYMGGPEDHPEASIRERAFRQALQDKGISFSEENIVRGDLSEQVGHRVAKLMAERDSSLKSWDALVSADDDMAYGLINELQSMGYKLPQDLAVTGFDNSDLSLSTDPTLTTAENSVYQLAQGAFQLLLDSIQNKPVKNIELPSPVVIRNSCGCKGNRPLTKPKSGSDDSLDSLEALYPYLSPHEQQELDELFESLVYSVENHDYKVFRNKVLRFIETKNQDSYQLLYQTLLDYLEKRAKRHFKKSNWEHLTAIISKVEMRLLEKKILKDRASYVQSRSARYHLLLVQEEMRNAMDLGQLKDFIDENLEMLQIKSLYLNLYENEGPLKGMVQLFYANRAGETLDVSQWAPFSADIILPQSLWKPSRGTINVLSPLFYGNQDLGYAIFQIAIEKFFIARSISRQLSNILTHIFKSQELREKNQILKNSIRELRITQERLMESERLAALGEMVAGIAHEINTPLGVGITLSSHMKEMQQELQEKTVKDQEIPPEWNAFLTRNNQALELLCNNLEKAAGMVRNYKMMAVDQASEQQRIFPIHRYIDDLITGLRSEYKHRNVTIELTGCQDLNIDSYPGFISQIISQLLMNTLQHGFPEKGGGKVKIELSNHKNLLIIDYSDDGVGIPEENRSKIFDPFFTTGRISGRSGLGMHIIYNIITARLGGSIELLRTDRGSHFKIEFPVDRIKE